jgi:hypothetical protein
MTSIYVNPKSVVFAVPYSDNNGDKISITYTENKPDIIIKAVDYILIDKDNIQWLIDALQDVLQLHKEADKIAALKLGKPEFPADRAT